MAKRIKAITCGTHYSLNLTLKKNGVIVPIESGSTAKLIIRKNAFSPILLNKNGVIDAVNGKITFNIEPEDTTGWLQDTREDLHIFGVLLDKADGSKSAPVPYGEVMILRNPAEV